MKRNSETEHYVRCTLLYTQHIHKGQVITLDLACRTCCHTNKNLGIIECMQKKAGVFVAASDFLPLSLMPKPRSRWYTNSLLRTKD